jgi:WD40 repeat protein
MATPNPERLKLVKDIGGFQHVFAMAATADFKTAFIGASDFKVSELDLSAAKPQPKDLYAHESYVTGVALVGDVLVSGGYDGKLLWWDVAAKKAIRTTNAHSKWIRKVIASPDGKLIASVADDMVCRLWDASSGKMLHELRGHQERTPHGYGSMLYAVNFSPDGHYLATGDKVGHIVVWDANSGKQLAAVETPVMYTWDAVQRLHSIGGTRSVAFSPDGSQLAVGGMGKVGNIDHLEGKARIEVFDWKAGKQIAEMQSDKFKGLVNKLAFAPDGTFLLGAGGGTEGFVVFLDVEKKKFLREEKMPMHVHDFAMTKTADTIVAVGSNKVTVHSLG